MIITDAASAEEYLFTVIPIKRQKGLDRMRHFLHLLGDPQEQGHYVHITGTNGKGSTAAYISSVLRTAGYCTGLYTSPHLRRVNERIAVNGEEIPDNDLVRLTREVQAAAETMDEPPSIFELITALGFLYFAERKCDIAVLEVGMGGIRDSTNVIRSSEVSVITPVGLDHCGTLGNTLAEIAWNKSGIIKPNGSVVVYPSSNESDDVFRSRCLEENAALQFTDFDAIAIREASAERLVVDLGELKGVSLPLTGVYQAKNAMTAVSALRVLQQKGWKISDEDIIRGLENTVWPGRFELLHRDPPFILDGSHNPHGFAATAESLRRYYPGKKPVMIMGIMEDKDYSGVLDLAIPLAERILTVSSGYHRALSPERLAELSRERGCEAECIPDPAEAVRQAFRYAGKDGLICAFGSLYLSDAFRNAVKELTV